MKITKTLIDKYLSGKASAEEIAAVENALANNEFYWEDFMPETENDTCYPPINFRTLDIVDNNVVLAWNDHQAYLWELQWTRVDYGFDSAQSVTIFNKYYNIFSR